MKKLKNIFCLSVITFTCLASTAFAKPDVVGVSTSGLIYRIDLKTGDLQDLGGEQIHNFNLGGIVRDKNTLQYIAVPSGSDANALYTADLKKGTLTHAGLGKVAGADDVRVMIKKGKKLFGIIYDGNAGAHGLYKIDAKTGSPILVADYSALNVEPIPGNITFLDSYYYTLVKPETDPTKRQLMKFRLNSKAPTLIDVVAADGASVPCDKVKVINKSKEFICLASISNERVDACKISLKGVTTCTKTLENVVRIAGGHTLMSFDGRKFYALVYQVGDENSQHLIEFNAKTGIKSSLAIPSVLIGAQLEKDGIIVDNFL